MKKNKNNIIYNKTMNSCNSSQLTILLPSNGWQIDRNHTLSETSTRLSEVTCQNLDQLHRFHMLKPTLKDTNNLQIRSRFNKPKFGIQDSELFSWWINGPKFLVSSVYAGQAVQVVFKTDLWSQNIWLYRYWCAINSNL
jgi:hypothetical protein